MGNGNLSNAGYRRIVAVIEMTGVVKRFGHATALDGLTMSVAEGDVHAFLGPNGSGKTTALRVLLGLIHADAGVSTVLGLNPWSDIPTLHRRLAYVPGDVALWPNLTGGEVIDLLGRLRGGLDPARRDALIARFELDPRKKSRSYSKGNRQKVALISALASEVDLYLLDEPTSGLDPLMEAAFRESIRELKAQGRTVLLSSHILSEAEALCDRVTIIREGAVIESGTLTELRHLTRTTVAARVCTMPTGLDAITGVSDVRLSEPTDDGIAVQAQVDTSAMPDFLVRLASCGVVSLESHPPTLEDLFLQHYTQVPP